MVFAGGGEGDELAKQNMTVLESFLNTEMREFIAQV